MANKVYITLEVDDRGTAVVKGFDKNTQKAFDNMKAQAHKASTGMGGSLQKLKQHWLAVTAVMTVAILAAKKIIDVAQKWVDAASNLQEVTSKFNVVFKDQIKRAEEWAATLVKSYAMSRREAKQYLASMQDLLKPMGMASKEAGKLSYEVVKLAADLGSFNNMPTAQVMGDIQSALVGNYETMKKYGVVLNATVVQEKALAMGLAGTKEELTAAHKAQAAYSLIVGGSKDAIGDMARTSGDYANVSKKLEGKIEDVSAALGNKLIPRLTDVKKGLIEVIDLTMKWLGPEKTIAEELLEGYLKRQKSIVERIAEIRQALVEATKTPRYLRELTGEAAIDIAETHTELVSLNKELAILERKIGFVRQGMSGAAEESKESTEKLAKPMKDYLYILKDASDEMDIMAAQTQDAWKNYGELMASNVAKNESFLYTLGEVSDEMDILETQTQEAWKNYGEALTSDVVKPTQAFLYTLKEVSDEMDILETQTQEAWNHYEKGVKRSYAGTKELAEAARELYRDLRKYEADYYKYSDKLIEIQAQRYRDLGIEEAAIEVWVTKMKREAWKARTLAAGSFFEGMKVGYEDMKDAQETWAEHGKYLFNTITDEWKSAVHDMVDAFIAGEKEKRNVAEITCDVLSNISGRMAKRMFDAAIDKIIQLIGAEIGLGVSGAGASGAMAGGVPGALSQIGIYLASGVGAMLAGRFLAEQFRAGGGPILSPSKGWIERHPAGGVIREGSGATDDVLLGYTPGLRHWGMGGEYVINPESTARHRELLDLINRDRGLATGGYLDRRYQEGSQIDWRLAADMLAIGGAGTAAHGFVKGGPPGALAELITFFAVAVPAMFAGKLLANQFKARGGPVDMGHGLGDFIGDIVGTVTSPLEGLPIIGDDIRAINDYLKKRLGWLEGMMDPEELWEHVLTLIRTPLEAVARDLVTPGKYYSNPLDTIGSVLDLLKKETEPERELLSELLSFQQGGLATRRSVIGERGPEWAVPTYEPERSRFLRDVGMEPERLARALAEQMAGAETETHIHLHMDGREVTHVVARRAVGDRDVQKLFAKALKIPG